MPASVNPAQRGLRLHFAQLDKALHNAKLSQTVKSLYDIAEGKREAGKQGSRRMTTKREGRKLAECAFEGLFASTMMSTRNVHDRKTCSEVYQDVV